MTKIKSKALKIPKLQRLAEQQEKAAREADTRMKELSARSSAQLGRLAGQVGRDLKKLQDRCDVLWQLVWALAEHAGLDEQAVNKLRMQVVGRWQQEHVSRAKDSLPVGKFLCERCLLIGGIETLEDIVCPRCNGTDIFIKEESDDTLPDSAGAGGAEAGAGSGYMGGGEEEVHDPADAEG